LPLGSLRVFVAVAQHLNFTRAADMLGVSASAASLQVRALEEYLSQPLFRRNGRQVRLTTQGQALLPRVQEALQQLEQALHDLRAGHGTGPLKITTLPSFLQGWLLPRMARFRADHPEIDVHLHASTDLADFVRDDFQLAIRLGSGGWPNVISEKLLDEWLLPVCSPALFEKYGPLLDSHDLRRYPLLHSVTEPWTQWLFDGRAEVSMIGVRGTVLDDSQVMVRMAAQSAGLALARWCLVADEIEKGTLLRASQRALRFTSDYWLVCPARAHALPSVRVFMDWIRAEAGRFPAPDR
jgi:LysR family glycine cleavage system transcriptional activator